MTTVMRGFDVELHFEEDHVWVQVVDHPNCIASGRDLEELEEALAEAIGICSLRSI